MRVLSYKLTQEDFSQVKPIDYSCFELFKPFQYKRLDSPVFFHSVMELICLGHFYWVIIHGCLVVFRVKRMYSYIYCIVYFSPISISNNVQDEQELLVALLQAGFSVRLNGAEAERLRLDLRLVNAHIDVFPNEFIYSSKEVLGLAGKKYKKIRNKIHRFKREGGTVVNGIGEGVRDFISSWAKMRGVNYNSRLRFLAGGIRESVSFLSFYSGNVVQGFSAIEKTGDFYSFTVGIPRHDCGFDMVPALDYYSILNLSNEGAFISAGSGSIKGVDFQKRRMHPYKEIPVYRVPAIGDRSTALSLVESFI